MSVMRQVAPYPTLLADIIKKIKYKSGWVFTLSDIDRGQGSEGLTLIIRITCPDSYYPDPGHSEYISVLHYMTVPPAAYDGRSWIRWLFDQILLVEQHEAAEFFQISGHRPYAPHHGPGNNPYTVFDQGTKEDAQTTFKGERFELDTPATLMEIRNEVSDLVSSWENASEDNHYKQARHIEDMLDAILYPDLKRTT